MKIRTEFEYDLKEKIYSLCCRENYFSCGTLSQYDRMFFMSTNENITVRDLSIMIWTCSSNDVQLCDIIDNLENIMQEIRNMERLQDDEKALARMFDSLDLEYDSDR